MLTSYLKTAFRHLARHRGYAVLSILVIALAVPIAYLAANAWLSRFAFRVELGAGLFLAGTGTALLLALLTVSYHAIRTALLNPAESLRYE